MVSLSLFILILRFFFLTLPHQMTITQNIRPLNNHHNLNCHPLPLLVDHPLLLLVSHPLLLLVSHHLHIPLALPNIHLPHFLADFHHILPPHQIHPPLTNLLPHIPHCCLFAHFIIT